MRYFLLFISLLFLPSTLVFAAEIDPMLDLDAPPDITFQFPKVQMPNIKMPDIKMPSYAEYKVKKGASNEVIPPQTQVQKKDSKLSSIKDFILEKFNKKKKQRPKFDTAGSGYSGTLPDVEADFDYKHPKDSFIIPEGENVDGYAQEDFQKAKTEDSLFLDAILNKGKPSAYVNEMFAIMRFLETFRTVIQNHDNIQKFNANVNMLDLYARKMEKLYRDKPEGMSQSYWFLQDLAYKAKILGNLKYDANYYSKFSPVQGTKYDPENLLSEDNKLLIDLDKTVFSIRQLGN